MSRVDAIALSTQQLRQGTLTSEKLLQTMPIKGAMHECCQDSGY
ncbi:hypothetical protein [Microcoleus sp. FACHB-SPT15]|nr:hypothetical protein [Microcoleus sp. FACHB-SPT15]